VTVLEEVEVLRILEEVEVLRVLEEVAVMREQPLPDRPLPLLQLLKLLA